MTPIGSDTFCTESSFTIILNRYFGYEADQDVPFEKSDAYNKYFSPNRFNMTGKVYTDRH